MQETPARFLGWAELTATTGLFLVTVAGTGALGDGLAIWDLRRSRLDGDLIDVVEVPLQGVEVIFALALQDVLAQLARHAGDDGWVGLVDVVEDAAELFVFLRVDGLDGDREDRGRERNLGAKAGSGRIQPS